MGGAYASRATGKRSGLADGDEDRATNQHSHLGVRVHDSSPVGCKELCCFLILSHSAESSGMLQAVGQISVSHWYIMRYLRDCRRSIRERTPFRGAKGDICRSRSPEA